MRKIKTQGPTARVWKMLWGWGKKYYISYALMKAFQTVIPFFNLWISAEIITALYEGREQKSIWTLVIIALAGNLIARALSSLFSYFVSKEERVAFSNEKEAFNDKALSLDYDKLENPETRMLRRKIKTNSWINNYGSRNAMETIKVLIEIVFNILFSAMLFAEMLISIIKSEFNIKGVLLLSGIVVVFVINILWSNYSKKKKAKLWEIHGQIMLEGNRLGGAYPSDDKDIRIYNMGPYIKSIDERYHASHKEVTMETNMKSNTLNIPAGFLSTTLQCLSYLVVCLYCGLGLFPIGAVIKYVGYIREFIGDIGWLLSIFANINENRPFLETYLEFFDIKNDMYQGSLSVEKRSDKKFDVEFKNVSFKYPESDKYALKNINFKFKVGERLAVVGMNGSGKTTLIKLLCRLYDPTEGEIVMNDFNIRKYDCRQYLDVFSVVFQDYNLLSFTLGQNVAARDKYDAEKAEKYLLEVGFGERYEALEKKLETPLYKNFDEDGVNISGGEAQKIVLARALYKDAPFIILDEPTAALDPLAEAEIYAKFNEIVGDKTAIYISHRLSSCRFCDKILVLDNGEIVQFGTHDELVTDENGKYYELWNAQAQYYTA